MHAALVKGDGLDRSQKQSPAYSLISAY